MVQACAFVTPTLLSVCTPSAYKSIRTVLPVEKTSHKLLMHSSCHNASFFLANSLPSSSQHSSFQSSMLKSSSSSSLQTQTLVSQSFFLNTLPADCQIIYSFFFSKNSSVRSTTDSTEVAFCSVLHTDSDNIILFRTRLNGLV